MYRRILIVVSTLVFAFAILFTSVLRTASVKYIFSQETKIQEEGQKNEVVEIDYVFPSPGRISPDSPFWPIKALRDRLWLLLTSNLSRKAELNLLFADDGPVRSTHENLGFEISHDFNPLVPLAGVPEKVATGRVHIGRSGPQHILNGDFTFRKPHRCMDLVVGSILGKKLHFLPQHIQNLSIFYRVGYRKVSHNFSFHLLPNHLPSLYPPNPGTAVSIQKPGLSFENTSTSVFPLAPEGRLVPINAERVDATSTVWISR